MTKLPDGMSWRERLLLGTTMQRHEPAVIPSPSDGKQRSRTNESGASSRQTDIRKPLLAGKVPEDGNGPSPCVPEGPKNVRQKGDVQYGKPTSLDDFYAYSPAHLYLHLPTGELWPAASVNGRTPWPDAAAGKKTKPSDWLDRNRAVDQMVWDPNEAPIIRNKVMVVSGYVNHAGASIFNLYRPPQCGTGDAACVAPWLDLLHRIYPADAAHIERYLAFKIQNPGVKINHALVLGGSPGIGKDTLLEPVREGVGRWNCQDIAPGQLLNRFNGFVKTVLLFISEARDLGDVDRFALYEHSKVYLAAPPPVIRVDEKNLREHYVANVCGVVITTNNRLDGLYLPPDDRRHYVAWSEATREDFGTDYWRSLYRWYEEGGRWNVVHYLRGLDLSHFDPKAPPPKTQAFWAMVQANEAPESGELRDVIEHLQRPQVLTLSRLIDAAESLKQFSLADELKDRKNRRRVPHMLDRAGYVPVRNEGADDGLFKVNGKRQAIYARKDLNIAERLRAARQVT